MILFKLKYFLDKAKILVMSFVGLGMIKRLLAPFRVLPTGYYRLFLLFWVIIPFACAVIDSSLSGRYDKESGAIEGFFWGALLYYPFMRIVLWVYNGFKQDKSK